MTTETGTIEQTLYDLTQKTTGGDSIYTDDASVAQIVPGIEQTIGEFTIVPTQQFKSYWQIN